MDAPQTAHIDVEQARWCLENDFGFSKQANGCWYWSKPYGNGLGPFRSFFLAANPEVYEDEIEDVEWVWTCGNGHRACINPDHIVTSSSHKVDAVGADAIDRDTAVVNWAQAIRTERSVREWSERKMAEELGVTRQTIRGWEAGEQLPRAKMRRLISNHLGWELEPRKWVVSYVIQDVVVASTAVEAIQKVKMAFPPQPLGGRKTEIIEARSVK